MGSAVNKQAWFELGGSAVSKLGGGEIYGTVCRFLLVSGRGQTLSQKRYSFDAKV
jgi:hypothetical protein